MAAKISENHQSRSFAYARYASRTKIYDVVDAADENEVSALVLATAPASYLGLTIETVTCECVSNGVWKATATYEKLANTNDYTFSTGGGTRHMTQSLATVNAYSPLSSGAPDFNGAINVSEDRVEGVDLPGPQYEFSETHYLPDYLITTAYKFMLAGMTGLSMNDADFKGFHAGEVALIDVSGSKRGDEQWGLTYKFKCSPNATGLSIAGMTIDKLGWDYLWLLYAAFEDGTAKHIVQQPIAAYVERVLSPMDYSLLGIGV